MKDVDSFIKESPSISHSKESKKPTTKEKSSKHLPKVHDNEKPSTSKEPTVPHNYSPVEQGSINSSIRNYSGRFRRPSLVPSSIEQFRKTHPVPVHSYSRSQSPDRVRRGNPILTPRGSISRYDSTFAAGPSSSHSAHEKQSFAPTYSTQSSEKTSQHHQDHHRNYYDSHHREKHESTQSLNVEYNSKTPRGQAERTYSSPRVPDYREVQGTVTPPRRNAFPRTHGVLQSPRGSQYIPDYHFRRYTPEENQFRSSKIYYGRLPLGTSAVYTVCPFCKMDIYTICDYQITWKTHLMVFIFCFCTLCLALVIYYFNCAKDAVHYCPYCGCYLGSNTVGF